MPPLLSRLVPLAAIAASLYPLWLWLSTALPFALPEPLTPAIRLVISAVAFSMLAGAIAGRWGLANVMALVALAWLVVCVTVAGPVAALAFCLSASAALAIGARLLQGSTSLTPLERAGLAYLAGMAVIVAVLSLLLAASVHTPAVYGVACACLIAWQRRALWQLLGEVGNQWRLARFARPPAWIAALAVLALLVGILSGMGALTPIAAFDDLAFHLRLPHELLTRHRYSFDVGHQVWAAAPWASDLAFAVPFMIAGGDEGVKAFVAGSYHVIGAFLLWGLLRRHAAPGTALICLAGYLSVPLLLATTHTLHTEGLTSALVIALFALWAGARGTADARTAIAAALLLGFLGAIKSSNLVLASLLGLLWLPVLWRAGRARWVAAVAIAGSLATALIPYAVSWVRTGNPVLPLFNAVFKSPYFEAVNFSNVLYTGMGGPGLFASLFLAGQRHLETGLPTAAGLGLFFLLPAAVLVAAAWGNKERRAALAVVIVYCAVVLSSQQYLRYLMPVVGLAFFAVSALWRLPLTVPVPLRWAWGAWWTALAGTAIVVNAVVMPGVFWQTGLADMVGSFTAAGRDQYLAKYAPERALNRAANQDLGVHATVLYTVDPFGADLDGTPLYANWYNGRLQAAVLAVKDAASAAQFYREYKVTHVVIKALADVPQHRGASVDALVDYAVMHGHVVARSGNDSLYGLDDELVWPRTMWSADTAQASVVTTQKIVAGAGAVTSHMPLLVEMEGTCDSPAARPGVDVFWSARGKPLGVAGRVAPCLAGADGVPRFSIRLKVQAPKGADQFWARFATYGTAPATVTRARVRALAASP